VRSRRSTGCVGGLDGLVNKRESTVLDAVALTEQVLGLRVRRSIASGPDVAKAALPALTSEGAADSQHRSIQARLTLRRALFTYAAAKAGSSEGLTRSLADFEYAPIGFRATSRATGLHRQASRAGMGFSFFARLQTTRRDRSESVAREHPARADAPPRARSATSYVFLLSDQASAITGATARGRDIFFVVLGGPRRTVREVTDLRHDSGCVHRPRFTIVLVVSVSSPEVPHEVVRSSRRACRRFPPSQWGADEITRSNRGNRSAPISRCSASVQAAKSRSTRRATRLARIRRDSPRRRAVHGVAVW